MAREQTAVVIDDSPLMRRIITDCLAGIDGLKVVAEAATGRDGLAKIREHSPDIVSLDVELGDINGLDVLAEVMRDSPRKVIVVSSHTEAGAETSLKALSLGAVDCVAKGKLVAGPDGFEFMLRQSFGAALLAQTSRLGRGSAIVPNLDPIRGAQGTTPLDRLRNSGNRMTNSPGTGEVRLQMPDLVLIASSTGGPMALQAFLAELTRPPTMPVVLVQHMPKAFTARLASRLDQLSPATVVEAADRSPLENGTILIARGEYHLDVFGDHVRFSDAAPIGGLKPRADVSFSSAARVFGRNIVAFVLTGMGDDGLAGCRDVVDAGGQVLAQDGDSCVVDGMPRKIRDADLAVDCGPPAYLGHLMDRLSYSVRPSRSRAKTRT
ncbi:MAG: chemotaxis-specific protein-glutamate methyltransferase CheB [Acidimicrobiales bacterium]